MGGSGLPLNSRKGWKGNECELKKERIWMNADDKNEGKKEGTSKWIQGGKGGSQAS